MSRPVVLEYIWLSGKDTHHDIRSKCKTVYLTKGTPFALSFAPEWNFDGSSTAQAPGRDTEIVIQPVAFWVHPFVEEVEAYVVLAECHYPTGQPTTDNTRVVANQVFSHKAAAGQAPWFGMEQEYILMQHGRPLNWPKDGEPRPQGPYYCSNGPTVAFGRKFSLAHYVKCLKMGLKISGTNAEVFPGQWEYQVGPCEGIEMGDQLVASRWVFLRLLELEGFEAGYDICFDVKPKKGDWNGSGLHTNFSTAETRAENGLETIHKMMSRLKETFSRDVIFYSANNNQRLTGHHETSTLSEFTFGVGTRGTSVRIPNDINRAKRGYFEDRRPGADADPYLVSARLFASACNLPAPGLEALEEKYRQPWMAGGNTNKSSEGIQQQQ